MKMKVCLVYTPFSCPSSMPLGIAYLKSYIEKNLPYVKIKNIDLNIIFFNRIAERKFNLCKHCKFKKLQSLPPETFTKSKRLIESIRSFKDKKKFYNLDDYFSSESYFSSFYNKIKGCYQNVLREFLEGKSKRSSFLYSKLLKDDIERIRNSNPNVVGFSISTENQLLYSLALIKLLKKENNLITIMGGSFFSNSSINIINIFDFIDYIIIGEGEIPFLEFLKVVRANNTKKIDGVHNLISKNKFFDESLKNEESFIDDINSIPFPDFSDFKIGRYYNPEPVFPILFSRGCPWKKCIFCTHYTKYCKKYRFRNFSNLIKEINYNQAKYNVKYFTFWDDEISAKVVEDFAKIIKEKKIKMYYWINSRPLNFTYKILKEAYDSGLRWIYFGVESLQQRILDLINKGTNVKEIKEILINCRKVGIGHYFSFIGWVPTKTKEELKNELFEIIKLKKYLYTGAIIPYLRVSKNSIISLFPNNYGIRLIGNKLLFFTSKGKVFSDEFKYISKGLTIEEANKLFQNFNLFPFPNTFYEHNLLLSDTLTKNLNKGYSYKSEDPFSSLIRDLKDKKNYDNMTTIRRALRQSGSMS